MNPIPFLPCTQVVSHKGTAEPLTCFRGDCTHPPWPGLLQLRVQRLHFHLQLTPFSVGPFLFCLKPWHGPARLPDLYGSLNPGCHWPFQSHRAKGVDEQTRIQIADPPISSLGQLPLLWALWQYRHFSLILEIILVSVVSCGRVIRADTQPTPSTWLGLGPEPALTGQ